MALYGTYYNFCRVHRSLQITPAMEAGLADEVKDVSWIVQLIKENTPAPGPAGAVPSSRASPVVGPGAVSLSKVPHLGWRLEAVVAAVTQGEPSGR